MRDAFQAWRELEADAASTFYIRTGGVSFCPKTVDYVAQVAANLAEIEVPHARLSGARWNSRHPLFSLPSDFDVVFEPDVGMILASRARAAMLSLAQERGVRVWPNAAVTDINSDASGVSLNFSRDSQPRQIHAERVIVAAGGWIAKLLPRFAGCLTPTLQHVFYLDPLPGGASGIGRFPAFIYKGETEAYYGMPDFPGSGVKAARDGGPELDMNQEPRVTAAEDRTNLKSFTDTFILGLSASRVIAEETCVYTMQDDHRFVVGPLDPAKRVFVASPCSGHGFKFSCYVGKRVADALLNDAPLPDAWLAPSLLATGSN